MNPAKDPYHAFRDVSRLIKPHSQAKLMNTEKGTKYTEVSRIYKNYKVRPSNSTVNNMRAKSQLSRNEFG